MLRSGVRLQNRDENSGFVSASISSDEMLLDPVEKTSPAAKKKLRKKSRTDKKGIVEQSSGEEPAAPIKKKKTKRSKNKDKQAEDVEEKKIARGIRRLRRQQATEEVTDTDRVSLRGKSSEDKENEQSAFDESLNSSAMDKSNRKDKSPKPTKSKNKAKQPDSCEERRKGRGVRRLQGQQTSVEVTETDRVSLRSHLKSASSEDKENEQSAIDESLNLSTMDKSNRKNKLPSKSPTKNKKKLMEVTDENLIETSVGKYTQSTRLLKEKLNAFDEPMDSSIVEDSMDASKDFLHGYSLKDLQKTKKDTFEMPNLVKDAPANVSLNSSRRDTFDVGKSKGKKRAFDIAEKPVGNAFDESFDTSLDSPTATPAPKTNNKSRSAKRSTFEVDKDEDANEGPKTKKRNTRELKIGTSPVKSPAKTTGKKRGTFEIKIETPQEVHDDETGGKVDDAKKTRGSIDINANGISPSPKKRGTYELEPEITEKPTKSPATRSSRRESLKRDAKKTPTLAVRKSISSMHRRNVASALRDGKIKISDSKTSLSESSVSSPSALLRRAQMLNPPSKPTTPKISAAQPIKKKTPNLNHSISKVKKVPNYTAIHQNAYNKMESIDDHLQRKADRAKALLSGHKVPLAGKRTPKAQDAKTKKQLFSTSLSDASNLPAKPNFKFTTKTTNSPMTFGLSRRQLAAGDASVLDASSKRGRSKKAVGFSVATPVVTRSSARLPKTPKPTKQEIWDAYGTKIPRAKAQSTPPTVAAPAVPPTVLFTMGKESPVVGKPAMPPKNLRLKQVTSVSTKSKGSTSTVDSRRDHIKGVRSNRRFDLLMSMRK